MARKWLAQARRDPAATWTSTDPVLAAGEPGVELDTGRLKLGDGITPWSALPYVDATAIADVLALPELADGDGTVVDDATPGFLSIDLDPLGWQRLYGAHLEDFYGLNTVAGGVGQPGWTATEGSGGAITDGAGSRGTVNLSTGVGTGGTAELVFPYISIGDIGVAQQIRQQWILTPGTGTDAQAGRLEFGWWATAGSAKAIFRWEQDTARRVWAVTDNGTTETAVELANMPLGAATSTFELHLDGTGTWVFSVNGTVVHTTTTTPPTLVVLRPEILQTKTAGTGTAVVAALDAFAFLIEGR